MSLTLYLDSVWMGSENSSFDPFLEAFNVINEATEVFAHHTLLTHIKLRVYDIVKSSESLNPTTPDFLKFQKLINAHLPEDLSKLPKDPHSHVFLTMKQGNSELGIGFAGHLCSLGSRAPPHATIRDVTLCTKVGGGTKCVKKV